MGQPRITVQQIEAKEFSVVRDEGYDPQEVDEYLDLIMDEMERMMNEIVLLRQELQEAKAVVQTPPVQPAQPEQTSKSDQPSRQQPSDTTQVLEILEMAQRIKEETIAKAQAEADALVSETRTRTESQMGDLGEQRRLLADEVERLKKVASDYRANFEALLQAQQEALDKATGLF